MNRKTVISMFVAGLAVAYGSLGSLHAAQPESAGKVVAGYEEKKQELVHQFGSITPTQWGETVTGVKTRIKTAEKIIALTMDACGSAKGMGFDSKLIHFLEREKVPATLFINARWIEPNWATFEHLTANPLFEIENHGLHHRPASITGRSVYGIEGTRSVGELVDEIELNNEKLAKLTGKGPRFYRSGTAYYDEVAVKVAGKLGVQVAGFSVLGDCGATYTRAQVRHALLSAKPGDIIIVHMNHPESGTADGVIDAVPILKQRGFRFVRLSDVELE